MNDAKTGQPAQPAAKPAEQGSATRLAVLLGILGIGLLMLMYDWMVLTPGCNKKFEELEKFVEAKNRQGVKQVDGGPKTAAADFLVTDTDVQKILGKPTAIIDKEYYLEEWYKGWGAVPINRNYIVVVYMKGKDGGPNRHHSHYKNSKVEDPPANPKENKPVPVDPNAPQPMPPDVPGGGPPGPNRPDPETSPAVDPSTEKKTEENTKPTEEGKPADDKKPADDPAPEEPKKEASSTTEEK